MNELPDALAPLAAYRQFCTWKLVPSARPGKMDKLPCDWRDGAVTNAHNPATWGTFDECAGAVRAGLGQGVGFVFTAADPFWFIDIDGALQADGSVSDISAAAADQGTALHSMRVFLEMGAAGAAGAMESSTIVRTTASLG